MNKAFVKEDDAWEEPEAPIDPLADIPAGGRNYMTPAGAAALKAELNTLAHGERPPPGGGTQPSQSRQPGGHRPTGRRGAQGPAPDRAPH